MQANRNIHGKKIYKETELIVRFKNTVSATGSSQMATQYAAGIKKSFGKNKHYKLVTLKAGQTVQQAMARFKSDPNVASVDYNHYVYPAATPNDTSFALQWGLSNTGQMINGVTGTVNADIGVTGAWDTIFNCGSTIVAVLDTGIHHDHPDLINNMVPVGIMADFVDAGDNDPSPLVGTGAAEIHGTNVAGIIGAQGNNTTGVSGVCWGVRILPIRVITDTGGTSDDLISGIDHAINNGARVINMSLALSGNSQAVSDAITRALNAGIVVVVAAGNAGVDVETTNSFTYPCRHTQANLICVAALNNIFGLATFSAPDVGSNFGVTSVDVGAPGSFIYNTSTATGYNFFSGTSQASPHVAGLAAMLIAYNPSFTYIDVVNAIKNGGTLTPSLSGTTSTGRAINALGSLHYINTPRGVSATVP